MISLSLPFTSDSFVIVNSTPLSIISSYLKDYLLRRTTNVCPFRTASICFFNSFLVRICRETHFHEELNGLRFKWTWWGSQYFVVVITNTSTGCFISPLLLCYPFLLFSFLLLLWNWFWTQTVIYPLLCDFVRILSLHKLLLRNSLNPYCTNKLRDILESYLHIRSHTHFIFH